MRTLITLILIMTSTLTLADCPKYQRINAGTPAPCDGVFFNNQAEQKLANDRAKLERDLSLTELQVQNRDQKALIWEAEAKRQADLRKDMEWDYKKGMFVGIAGSILMFFVTSAAIKAAR